MRCQFRTLLLVFVVVISNTLVLSAAAAHEADLDHATHECSVCISAHIDDGASPVPGTLERVPFYFLFAVIKPTSQVQWLKLRYSPVRARAPPSTYS